jgi:hypothetical protein
MAASSVPPDAARDGTHRDPGPLADDEHHRSVPRFPEPDPTVRTAASSPADRGWRPCYRCRPLRDLVQHRGPVKTVLFVGALGSEAHRLGGGVGRRDGWGEMWDAGGGTTILTKLAWIEAHNGEPAELEA